MSDKEPLPKFPEKKVDDLIASFGREPDKQQMDKIREAIQQERGKYGVMSRLRERTQNRSRGRDTDRGR